jgi:predicted oxidoreductase
MKTYRIPHTDLTVSRIAYGCGVLGHSTSKQHLGRDGAQISALFAQWKTEPLSSSAVAHATRMVNAACDHGITFFDHADIYNLFGKSVEAFGAALKQSPGLREKIVIQSKCGIRFAEGFLRPRLDDPHRTDFSREHIVRPVETSLERLGTDRLDIFLLHRPDALMEPEEVADAFDALHRSGKVRYFGVSNHTAGQIELLKRYLHQPLVVNQLHVGLAHSYLIADGLEANRQSCTRITEGYTEVAGTLDYCRLNDIQIQAWSPLKGDNDSLELLRPKDDAAPKVKQAARELAEIAARRGVQSSAVALAWLLRHPARIVPIIGTTSVQHLHEACVSDDITLSREEWYTLLATCAGVTSHKLLGLAPPEEWL